MRTHTCVHTHAYVHTHASSYVHYYEQLLKINPYPEDEFVVPTPTYQITHIRLITVPNFDSVLQGYEKRKKDTDNLY